MTDPSGQNDKLLSTYEVNWSQMVLSHHYPHQYSRCVVIGGKHVCRRCLVVWPLTFVVFVLLAGTSFASKTSTLLVAFVLCMPAFIDWLLENLGRTSQSNTRLTILSLFFAVGAGEIFAYFIR